MALIDLKSDDRFEATSDGELARLGIKIRTGTNFREYKEIAERVRPGHVVGDAFPVGLNETGKTKGLWMVGEANNEIMYTQALRVLDMEGRNFAEYFRTDFEEFLPPGIEINPELTRYRPGPGAKRIRGKVVYSGETWIGGDPGACRGSGLSNLLGKRTMLAALRAFDADYVVGFMAKPVAYKGFCLRMGFMHAEPHALRMHVIGKQEPLEGVMVYMSAEDIDFVLGLPHSVQSEALAA